MLSARCCERRPSQFSPQQQVRVISTSNIRAISCSLVRPQDKEAEKTVLAFLKQTTEGYMVGLPWKSVAPSLEDNYTMAFNSFREYRA